MEQVKDTSETMWNVYDVLYADQANQIYPNHVQINIGQNVAERGITLPDYLAKRWLGGEIRIALPESTQTGEK